MVTERESQFRGGKSPDKGLVYPALYDCVFISKGIGIKNIFLVDRDGKELTIANRASDHIWEKIIKFQAEKTLAKVCYSPISDTEIKIIKLRYMSNVKERVYG